MSEILPKLYIARHGETGWNLSGRHTKLTDLPLTEGGESNARRLGNELRGSAFAYVFASALRNYVVWWNCSAIAALGLLSFGVDLMRFGWMFVQVQL